MEKNSGVRMTDAKLSAAKAATNDLRNAVANTMRAIAELDREYEGNVRSPDSPMLPPFGFLCLRQEVIAANVHIPAKTLKGGLDQIDSVVEDIETVLNSLTVTTSNPAATGS